MENVILGFVLLIYGKLETESRTWQLIIYVMALLSFIGGILERL